MCNMRKPSLLHMWTQVPNQLFFSLEYVVVLHNYLKGYFLVVEQICNSTLSMCMSVLTSILDFFSSFCRANNI